MPVIINPKNMAEYKREKAEQNQKKPAFTTVKWGKAAAKEGEEVELTAQAKDIEDGNMAAFQVWKEGQDPASHVSYHRIPATIEGGMAKGKWLYRPVDVGDEVPPDEDPKFFFTVHSAWCQYKESGKLTVELIRPELSGPEWQDGEGKSADKGLVGEALKLSVSCNGDMEEGTGVTFRVYPEGADPKRDRAAAELASSNRGGKAEAEWTYQYRHDPEKPLTEKPKFFFTAVSRRCKEAKSGNVEIGMEINITASNQFRELLEEVKYTLYRNGESQTDGQTGSDGLIAEKDQTPGLFEILISEGGKPGGGKEAGSHTEKVPSLLVESTGAAYALPSARDVRLVISLQQPPVSS
jgi:hypothetical protein